MAKRNATSADLPSKNKKMKLTGPGSHVESDSNTEKQDSAKHVWSITELGERIFRFIPRDQVRDLQRVCKQFLALTKYSGVQQYLYNVPPRRKAGKEVLQFRGEKIADFVDQIGPHCEDRSFVLTTQSCIQGYGGERFVNKNDEAYENISTRDADMMLENDHCAKPCLLDSRNLAACNLNPGPFKRIVCMLLVQAWDLDKVSKNAGKKPMQPEKFQITCDAKLVGDISWTKYCMKGRFSEPQPKTTFEATVNWIFELLAQYSETRNINIEDGGFVEEIDYMRAMTFWAQQVKEAFRAARYKSWSLEQTCYIVDRIPEERHP